MSYTRIALYATNADANDQTRIASFSLDGTAGWTTDGVFRTFDSGATWTKVADLRPNAEGFHFTPNWFGCYAWDSVNNILYASSMGNPVYQLQLAE